MRWTFARRVQDPDGRRGRSELAARSSATAHEGWFGKDRERVLFSRSTPGPLLCAYLVRIGLSPKLVKSGPRLSSGTKPK